MSSTSLVEAFLLIEQPRQRIGHWTAALASLDTPLAPAPVAVVAYYDPTCDQALLNLQYDEAILGASRLEFVVQVALLAEVGLVQPTELSEGARVQFLATRLTRCSMRVTGQRSVLAALGELVEQIKNERTSHSIVKPLPSPTQPQRLRPPTLPARPRVPMPARPAAPAKASSLPQIPSPTPPTPSTPTPSLTSSLTPSSSTPTRSLTPPSSTRPPTPSTPIPALTPSEPIDDPPITAKGTRDDLERITGQFEVDIDMDSAPPSAPIPVPPPPEPPEGYDVNFDSVIPSPPLADLTPPNTYVAALERVATNTSRHVVARSDRASTLEMPVVVRDELAASYVSADGDDRVTAPIEVGKLQELTARVDPTSSPRLRPPMAHELADNDDVKPPAAAAPATVGLRKTARQLAALARRPGSEPYVQSGQQPGMIYARYLRGGRWVPVRVGALSLNGAALLAGALPRESDRVDIALTFGTHRALVRGTVAKVSTVREAATTGASTFSVSFQLDGFTRRQLTTLLVAARDAKITIKPPPPRATRRFPVEWQIGLATPTGALKATALDVSTGGMFVRTPVALELGVACRFSVVLDDGGAPVAGRAKVVRKITDAEARTCGLAAGFGLGIVEMSETDRMRWLGFLARIERRAEKRVLIGAEPARLAELQAGLASLGYAVTGGTDPGTLVQLANGDSRPADAVLIDRGWLQNAASTSLVESLFSARNVPCVTMHGEVRRARQAIDRLLEVVV